jgi:hypothetical protein
MYDQCIEIRILTGMSMVPKERALLERLISIDYIYGIKMAREEAAVSNRTKLHFMQPRPLHAWDRPFFITVT